MPKFIMLMKYTDEGVQHFKTFQARTDLARKGAAELGVTIDAFYLTMGEYDLVLITEAPDDQTVARLLLGVGSLGNVSTQTLRAFTEDEFRQLVGSMP